MAEQEQRETKPCKECGLEIPSSAKLCNHCQSHQDWRHWLSFTPITIALVTALVSVTGLVAPIVGDLFHNPESDAKLTHFAVDGNDFRALAINTGDEPATITRVWIGGEILAPATKIRFKDDEDAFISTGSRLISFEIIPLLNEDESYDLSMGAILNIGSPKPIGTSINFIVTQSDGRESLFTYELTGDDLFRFLRANADRCSGISNPNFENGCVGTGAPPEEILSAVRRLTPEHLRPEASRD